LTDFKNKKILVVGLGKSGLATACWLAGEGAEVTVSEMRPLAELNRELLLEVGKLGIRVEAGGHCEEDFLKAELIVASPGVPLDLGPLRAARSQGIPIRGDLELAIEKMNIPVLAVTGTNGKSTVTTFLGTLLTHAGRKVFVGGNIGTPVFEYLSGHQKADYAVLEISSFQLDLMERFSPLVSILLNITPDHLDRYPDYEAYIASKLSITRHQGSGQYAILNDEDERLHRFEPGPGITVLRYGMSRNKVRQAFLQGEHLVISLPAGKEHFFDLKKYKLPGRHNLENLMACGLAGLAVGVAPSTIQRSIDDFRSLAHRLEWAGTVTQVDFYDDSKATNIDAAIRAMQSFDRPVILIAGGRHKGADYEPLVRACSGRVRAAVFMGEAKELLSRAFKGRIPFTVVQDMGEAVRQAYMLAGPGEVVLLAPACSSFDMFTDYAQRGRAFSQAVQELQSGR
jgi:UDP-N-acetylmuramoylalanine--D-glutamate ligase